jgi:cobalt-precorrin 5A hydrolase/precorrin-3B C17-methyltransferase
MILPGISALQAAASRAGAPLGHDFCVISLSDLMTPWERIRGRIEAAASADFVVALYNPSSARRQDHLAEAAAILLQYRPSETPVFIGRNLGRDGEERRIICLSGLAGTDVDMLTIVLVGSSRTRLTEVDPAWLYTPRGYFDRGIP